MARFHALHALATLHNSATLGPSHPDTNARCTLHYPLVYGDDDTLVLQGRIIIVNWPRELA